MSNSLVTPPRTRRDLVKILLIVIAVSMIGTVLIRKILFHPETPAQRREAQEQQKEASQTPGRPEQFEAQQDDRLKAAEIKYQKELAREASAATATAASTALVGGRPGAVVPGAVPGGTLNSVASANEGNPLPPGYRLPPTRSALAVDSDRLADAKARNPFQNVSLVGYEASSDSGPSSSVPSLPPGIAGLLRSATTTLPNSQSSAQNESSGTQSAGQVNTESPIAATLKGLASSVATGEGLPQLANAGGLSQLTTGVGPKNTQWLAKEAKSDSEGDSPLTAKPLSSVYTLQAPGLIKVVALEGFNSTLPTEARALVTDDVYDNIPGYGTHLLIRKGSILALHPNTDIVRGQNRMMMAFTRINLYGGATVNLGAMSGADDQGVGGIPADDDSHLLRRFGAATLLAGVSAIAEHSSSDGGVNVNLGSSVTSSSETALSQLMTAVLGDSINIQDTLTIKPGQTMVVVVNRDLYLPPNITGNAP